MNGNIASNHLNFNLKFVNNLIPFNKNFKKYFCTREKNCDYRIYSTLSILFFTLFATKNNIMHPSKQTIPMNPKISTSVKSNPPPYFDLSARDDNDNKPKINANKSRRNPKIINKK